MAYIQNERLQKDRVKKSVLGKLSERQKDLFILLAADGWRDYSPKLNKSTQRLLSSQSPEKQWNLVQDWSRRWPGLVSKQGVIQFLATGYASQYLPGGFTVFMFSPLKHKRPSDKRDRKRNIKGSFGKDGALDDEAVEFYATLDYHMPESIHDAETQLEMAVLLLETLMGKKSIATDGYMRGLEIIEKNRASLHEEISKDRRFMSRFLHFLDVVFNRFCDDLAEFHTRRSPIESAKHTLRGRMKGDIVRVMRDLRHGITPNLPLPETIEDNPSDVTDPAPRERAGSSLQDRPSRNEMPESEHKPTWWSRNPEEASAWEIPDDKSMRSLFSMLTTEGKENIRRFPKLKHHNPVVTGTKPVCIKYQCKGKCRLGCPHAHVKPGEMTTELRRKTDEAFKKAYE
jgi:hypothetical protein